MCIAFFLVQAHPLYSLVIASNRDEYFARPTAAAHFWSEYPDIFAGRDEEAGGTWLGLSRSGRIALLTNFREAHPRAAAPTRGNLTRDLLLSARPPLDYLESLQPILGQFNGFNLVGVDIHTHQTAYLSNRSPDAATSLRPLSPGIHGLSNALLDTAWLKVERGKAKLMEMVRESAGRALSPPEIIQEVLCDTTQVKDEDLPVTEVSVEIERKLCSTFVNTNLNGEAYGTSYQTVIMVRYDGKVEWHERVLDTASGAHVWTEHDHVFDMGHLLRSDQCAGPQESM
mmetsp:Transcript_38809/g.53913  ORF Transcript_38809/g.53913 Transcript_38809/m.53913 type:complete len:285 (+) Transcript_38809:75-929(+)|eukprot:CAMPEP_0196583158 /NCGR_PEP_ID=MMETSP1081-20130531/42306_1 /TAXON_ID=36882 /ORGANISM="Pyramimonas amylifera, Strain CCMP720" /LENGTH=284 /DNA_ID=CAMNT_0041903959 /DNA_START=70 /DNA_END=924 /DNA_ORIENTATION=+